MKSENKPGNYNVSPVPRSKEQAKRFYNRISRIYGSFGIFERKYSEMALEQLSVKEGDTVLEVGFGPGHCLKKIAESVGRNGKAYGVDISAGMAEVAKRRLEKAGLSDRVKIYCGDATELPYADNTFDAVFMSFTLELFDTPEIPVLLNELKRVLKPGGRIAIVSMSREGGESLLLRFYEWLHKKLPEYIDCRPIYAGRSISSVGYEIMRKITIKIFGLSGEIVLACKKVEAE